MNSHRSTMTAAECRALLDLPDRCNDPACPGGHASRAVGHAPDYSLAALDALEMARFPLSDEYRFWAIRLVGKANGYPSCCIDAFVTDTRNGVRFIAAARDGDFPALRRCHLAFPQLPRYVPCPACAVRIVAGMPGETARVVNIKSGAHHDVYIGRFHRSKKYGVLPRSKWANPFDINKHVPDQNAERQLVIAKYRDYILGKPDLIAALPKLRGKVLGCWCKPLACHGDVLVELLET